METGTKLSERGKLIRAGRLRRHKLLIDGAKLTSARVAAGLRGQDVADHIKVNKATVCKYEQGKVMPSDDKIVQLIALLGSSSFVIDNKNGVDRKRGKK